MLCNRCPAEPRLVLQLIETLSLLLQTSPVYSLLASLPAPSPTNPTASSYHAIQLAVASPLKPLLELVSLVESVESQSIEDEVKKRRQRLGGTTLSAAATRRAVESEYMRSSRLPSLYQQILEDPDASDQEELRRETERKLLTHLTTLLRALPSTWNEASLDLRSNKGQKAADIQRDEDEMKTSVRAHVQELASGMVTIRAREEAAWFVVLEWSDSNHSWQAMDWRELLQYCEVFPR